MNGRTLNGRTFPPRTWLLRLVGGVVLFLAIAGPAPGNVGGCGNPAPVADVREHCRNSQFYRCLRDQATGRITGDQYNDCVMAIESTCVGMSWPPNCFPTPAESDQCLILLSRTDLAHIETDQLLEMYDDCRLCD